VAAALRLMPESARFAVGVDVAALRAAPITARLSALRVVFGAAATQLDALAAKTGIDPWTQVDSVTLGGVSSRTDLAFVVRGHGLDEARLTAFAREQLSGSDDELVSRAYGKRTIWSARKSPDSAAVFVDAGTLVLATPAWAERIVDLADGAAGARNAASNAELATACATVAASPLWGAGVLPQEVRDYLEGDLRVRSVASMRHVSLAVDLAQPLIAKLAIDFGDAAQADQLAEEIAQVLDRARREKREYPYFQALFKGLTEYADGSTFRAELRLDDDIVVQIAEGSARFVNQLKQPSELAPPTPHALTLKPDWLSPPPTTIALGAVRTYDAWDRRTHALIEVVNRSNKPVVPEIRIRYRDQRDRNLEERPCVLPMLVLLARERVACDPGVPAGAASGIYTIRTAPDDRAAAFASSARTTLKIVGARLETLRGPAQWLLGEVKNTTGGVVRGARVHATFYDAEHKIVGYADDALEEPEIAAGASAHFRVASGPLFAPVKSFAAIAYSLRRAK
jgi:hypothetical protein